MRANIANIPSSNTASSDAPHVPDDTVSFNGHHYYVFNNEATYADAENYCKSLGGYLASITSQEENDFLYDYICSKGIKNAYFGFTDRETEGTWKWVNGEEPSYTNWASGEPNAESSDEDYAMFYWKFTTGKWNDGNFGNGTVSDETYYICEWDDGQYSNDKIITYETNFSFPEDAFATAQAKIGDNYNGYYIKSNHYSKLTKEMSPSEKEQIVYVSGMFSKKSRYNIDGQSKNYVAWGGSCYGVAVASLLNSNGILTVSDFNASAERLRSVTFDNQATSVCNFYFCQQVSSQIQSLSKKFQNKPVVDRLGFIEKCIKEGNPVIICFSWVEYKKNSLAYSFIMNKKIIESSTYGHTVLGYGAELSGAWKRTVNGIEKIYSNRIKIYDCNAEAEDDKYWLYYNENGDWCIPVYKAIGNAAEDSSFDSGFTATIQLASASTEEINIIDYHTGNYNREVAANNDVISLAANNRYKLTWGDGTACIIKGLDYEWVGEGKKDISLFVQTNGDGTDICEVVLPDDNCDYEITSDENIEFAILRDGKFISVIGDNLGIARVADRDSISLEFDKESSYSISTTNDEENGLCTVVVTGIKTSEVEIRRGDSDVEIISDNTNEMLVKTESKEEKEDCIEILNNYSGLKILQEAGEISAYGDSEGAGTYENKAEYRYFDENANIASAAVSIEENTFIYTGEQITPAITVKDVSNNILVENTDYTITYSDNINAGMASVTITGIGNYEGSVTKSFQITLAEPVLSSAANVVGGVKITWDAVPGAEKYRVFRKTYNASTKKWSKWANITDTTSVNYTDKTVATGTKYKYTVRCISEDGKTYTSSYDSAGKKITYVAAPTISSLKNVNGGVKVVWPKTKGASKYRVFRKTGSGKWTKLADTTSTTYTDKKASNGKTYAYTIRCLNSSGKNASAYNTTGKSITYVQRPAISSLTSPKTKQILVKWSKNKKATGYQIQYSTSSTFAKGNKTVTVKGASKVSKTISKLKSKKKYYVRIRTYKTVNGKKYYSAWSAKKKVTTK